VYITTYQPDNKSNLNPKTNPNPIAKQQSVNIQQNIVTYPTYAEKSIQRNVVAPSVLL